MSNNRTYNAYAPVINGVSNGAPMSIRLMYGWDQQILSYTEGGQVPTVDFRQQFLRGLITTQDWLHIVDLLTGTVGTLAFSERSSGIVEATGYRDHSIANPVIHTASFNFRQGSNATVTASFEVKFTTGSKISDMWTITDGQAAPDAVTAAHGGYELGPATHGGSLSIDHLLSLTFALRIPLIKACNPGEYGYDAVDLLTNRMTAAGAIGHQDGSLDTDLLGVRLVEAARGDLAVPVVQAGGAAAKTITIKGVQFPGGSQSISVGPYSGHSHNFISTSSPAELLTLTGDNKILAVA